MWMLFLLILVNAAADEQGWAYPIRFQVGMLSVNFFFMMLLLATVMAVVRGGNYRARFPTPDSHPLLRIVLSLLGVALISGVIALFLNDPSLLENREVGFGIRDFMALPLAIWVGYRLTAEPKSGERFIKAVILTGIAASLALILAVASKAAQLGSMSDINAIRTNAIYGDYAGIACAVILFAIASGNRILPAWIAALVAGFCLIGQFAPLHRSSWIACFAGLLSIVALLPPERRFRSLMIGAAAGVVLAGSLWLGVIAASHLMGGNFAGRMEQRIQSLLPTERRIRDNKAWDTRVGSALVDLETFATSPVFGRGFGIQESLAGQSVVTGAHHNSWTDIMAKTGLLGLVPAALVVGGSIVIGRRMVRERADRASMLVGALGVIAGSYYLVHGLSTWSFNSFRGAVGLGVIFGVLLRCREMQLANLTSTHPVGELDLAALGVSESGADYAMAAAPRQF